MNHPTRRQVDLTDALRQGEPVAVTREGCADMLAALKRPQRAYGYCTACRSIEVALNNRTGTIDFSNIGEAANYPAGFGCEVCS